MGISSVGPWPHCPPGDFLIPLGPKASHQGLRWVERRPCVHTLGLYDSTPVIRAVGMTDFYPILLREEVSSDAVPGKGRQGRPGPETIQELQGER